MTETDAAVSTAGTGVVPAAGVRFMPPEELAMQSLTKQLYKSRLFRGIYLERCFVEQLGGYRDVIALQRSERDLEKQLLSSAAKLQLFYQRIVPNMWVGITKGSLGSYKHTPHPAQLDTCVWTELSDLAFGEYWFSIRTLRFRGQEVQLKLKMIRAVEADSTSTLRHSLSMKRGSPSRALTSGASPEAGGADDVVSEEKPAQIGLDDFLAVLQQWRQSVVTTVYEFMANDVNKRNIMGTLRFLGLLIFSILSGAVVALRFMGIFAVRFLFELSRFTHTATPIVFKLIEFFNKIVGAFFILIAMIWKDLVVNRGGSAPRQPLESSNHFKSITYEKSESHRRSPRYGSSHYR
ncbi:uncharacterized protein [Drosophila virilis]|uniref:Uncharacterized protein, isoform A n=1 Tax=Drosophila virilis TaxID=7244 RepID=B4LX97_DROVI|nr:uncharacterized protein LOC6630984 [Drosophila virilis]XP_015027226.1 uncharacterized protein LOC6630984 [Drosophila virilis]XP_032292401.1 uncharacterized protein LOC6630984 [Drosophila virilis]EDW66749.1 uncharacterized protein Dvir_GJ23458, isoform A [Drosophila virilis]KRF82906.1 uncharacterized protein Dvir_GJ23458, isoform B [Drosophila virilis]